MYLYTEIKYQHQPLKDKKHGDANKKFCRNKQSLSNEEEKKKKKQKTEKARERHVKMERLVCTERNETVTHQFIRQK